MPRVSRKTLSTLLCLFVTLAPCSRWALAQNSHAASDGPRSGPNSASARHSELQNFEQYVSYWTTEPGWRTELQLRNNLDPGELTVTPALRSADGTETTSPDLIVTAGKAVSSATLSACWIFLT